ncbi:phosphotransferase family protein [uncultured Jatrophihabitans sp.]|uniref:phosphotransferase family protein n=1 Tax=uncultured Jatrophihabitans sp. TaxID=1610747 RepID=UPI0035C998D0
MSADQLPPSLVTWLSERLGAAGPFTLTPISGGHSNETGLLTSPDGRWIVRRPPAMAISATANNLAREHRVMSALARTAVPVPRTLAFAESGEVDARSCLVMSVAEGYPLTDTWPTDWPQNVSIGDAGFAAVGALATLHAVDVDAVGLTDFGRPGNYLERQVARWRGQYEQNAVRKLPRFEALGAWLAANRPEESAAAILHGDFHLDNCLIVAGTPPRVSAIIDWELATIGDPLVDLGLLLAFWGPDRAMPVAMPKVQALTRAPKAPSRRSLADRYTELTGRPTDALAWFMVLALFKLAAIVEGAYARAVRGLDDDPWARSLGEDVPRLLADAARFAT